MKKTFTILALFFGLIRHVASAATLPWLLPNFSDRLELSVSNPEPERVHVLVEIPIANVSGIAPGFPGTLAIAVVPGGPLVLLPSQINEPDGFGRGRAFVFPADVPGHTKITVDIYYSRTLHAEIPWQRQAFASHSFGYNHATAALESEKVGYRTYGGFFLDVQARAHDHPGLMNELVGFLSASASSPSPAGQDVLHIGDTLGLGGLFVRSAGTTYRPPLNMPDYAHKPSLLQAPVYRVLAAGPVEAVIQAKMNHWSFAGSTVSVTETYSIFADNEAVRCHFRIVPLTGSSNYEVGAGIRTLPRMRQDDAPGRLSLMGEQDKATGPIGLALYFDEATASPGGLLHTPDGDNDTVVFHSHLGTNQPIEGTYWVAAAWSGTGIQNLLQHLRSVERQQTASSLVVGGYTHSVTPAPQRLKGEAY